ncbi:AMP-binding enzyme family protein [Mycobacterium ulcerans str. Harvey]|uniref:AMP-binding enzyme family protein n=1 Tax=Mycobacterium ulcerans str. Harvey TaxID=1299332 RepID=A0ABN0R7K2_MYCUL|nr:AMP-binding enzyme family protein [Mycobacterium ulcerans str. Harvey]
MQDFPLTITAIMRHGCGVHGSRQVITATGDAYRQTTYREVGQRAAQLANALRGLGISGDQRVATFMWNNAEHLVTYLAVPSMGAVLHTLNIRLFAEQIAYVANEAEDQVVLVDLSLTNLLAPVLPNLDTVHTVIAVGEGTPRRWKSRARPCCATTSCSTANRPSSTGRTSTRTPPPPCVTPAVPPDTRKVLYTAIVQAFCTRWRPVPQTVSAWDPAIECCRSCRCFMPTPGGCPTPH